MDKALVASQIDQTLKACKRAGMNSLLTWLSNKSECDFFTAPASTRFHCDFEGGLAQHSWNVYDLLIKKNEQFLAQYDYDTLAICGLLHDACKINFYKMQVEEATAPQMKYLTTLYGGKLPSIPGPWNKTFASKLIEWKVNQAKPKPEYTPGQYVVEDTFPCGHGAKSVIMLQRFIQLTEEEVLAITWHMSMFDPPDKFSYGKALEKSMLVTLLFTADMEASNILERKTNGAT